MRDRDASNGQPFVLLCGCPRSGTTLLAQMMEEKLSISIPLETHFIPHFQRILGLWGDLRSPRSAQALLACLTAYTRIWVHLGVNAQSPTRHAMISLLPDLETFAADRSAIAAALAEAPDAPPFERLLRHVYGAFARRGGTELYGDKSAPFEPEPLSLHDAALPNLRVVHIARDGRDVCLSWRPHWFGPRSVLEAAQVWRGHVEGYRAWGRAHPDRYLEIRYEDLLAQGDTVIDAIATFLDVVRVSKEMGQGTLAAVLKDEPTHYKMGGPLDPSNRERWRREMTAEDHALFVADAGETLASMGYDITTAPPPPSGLTIRRAWARLRAVASTTWLRRRLRDGLPLGLRIAQLLGISPLALTKRFATIPRSETP